MLGAIATMFPAFRPDNRDGIAIDSEGDTAETWWANIYSPALAARDVARAVVVNTAKAGHEACIAVCPIMKSRYRGDKGLSEAIEKLARKRCGERGGESRRGLNVTANDTAKSQRCGLAVLLCRSGASRPTA